MPDTHNFKSSFLAGCSYDEIKKVLTVMFTNGKEYEYAGVPKEVYDGFTSAPSAGTYFSSEIKGKYQAPEPE